MIDLMLFQAFLFHVVSPAPTYFTIWLNDGTKLAPYMDQLIGQNERFGDLLVVDADVYPFVLNHGRVVLDKPIFGKAKANNPLLSSKIAGLESIYDLVKPLNPAAASDILRFTSFLGLEGNEFVYHDVDVRIAAGYTGSLRQPLSSAVIGTPTRAHLGKNWIMRAISFPTREMNLVGANINTDLICVVRSDAASLLSEYIERSFDYFEKSLTVRFVSNTGRIASLLDIVTSGSDETYTIENIEEYHAVTGSEIDDRATRAKFSGRVTRRFLQSKMTFGASIAQYERILQRVFASEYHIPISAADEYDPYAVADRKYVFQNLVLRGESRGVLDFVRDYVADPGTYGVVSRKNNVDWHGESATYELDVETLNADPLDGEALDGEAPAGDDTDYEEYEEQDTYDETKELEALTSDSIDVSTLSMFCGGTRRKRSIDCYRNDPERYEIIESSIVFDADAYDGGRAEISAVSNFVFVHTTSNGYKRFRFVAADAVQRKLTLLKAHLSARIERILRLPSGRNAMYELRNQYSKLVSPRPVPMYGETSRVVRKFNRLSFGVGYATSLAFSAQFLARAVSSDIDIPHRVVLGAIGSMGVAELAYMSSVKIAGVLGKNLPASVLLRAGAAFKVFGIATAIYFAVDSSVAISKDPGDLEAWWWLTRSVTIFTPLNRILLPVDIAIIVSKQIVSASWDLSTQQNHMRMTQSERMNYHALSFFGISTRWISDVRNGGIFKINVVNPTVRHLRSMLHSNNYGVVGYPTTTVCKSTERLIYNTIDSYDTNVNSYSTADTVPTVVDKLSATRMQTCLTDAETLCAPRDLSGWEWFVSVFAQASRVRGRGVDMGVGCILLDGTVLSGDPCSSIERMKRDIKDREKVFVVGPGSDTLPFMSPAEYDFDFKSVSNGSIDETSYDECLDVLSWNNRIAPYFIVNRGKTSGRVDYIGIPASSGGGETTMTVMQNNPARVYVYKSNKNGRRDTITIDGCRSYDTEFVVLESENDWTLDGHGRGTITFRIETNATFTDADIRANSVIARGMRLAEFTLPSSVVVQENQTSPVISLTSSCSFIARQRSEAVVMVDGDNTSLLFEPLSAASVQLDNSHVDISVSNLANVQLKTLRRSSAVIKTGSLAKLIVPDLSMNWTIKRINETILVQDGTRSVHLLEGSMILSVPGAVVVTTVGTYDTVVFLNDIIPDVLHKLHGPAVFFSRNGTIAPSLSGGVVPSTSRVFVVAHGTNVTIPHQSRKRVDFYGSVHIDNEMIKCGRNGPNCEKLAHYDCSEAILVCSMN